VERFQTGFGLVAQRLAQATHNRLVAGSNPAGPTEDDIRTLPGLLNILVFHKFFQGNTVPMSPSTALRNLLGEVK
jgi:hypothetical protein